MNWLRAQILHWLGLGLLDQYVRKGDPISSDLIRGRLTEGHLPDSVVTQSQLRRELDARTDQRGTSL